MQYNNDLIEEIFFQEILPKTKDGVIDIPIYNTNSNGDVFSFNITLDAFDEESPYYLEIHDKEKLINLLYEYTSIMLKSDSNVNSQNVRHKIEYYLALVWTNATYDDLRHPELFIQKYIDFNNNPLFDDFIYASGVDYLNFADIDVIIKKESANMETPYSFNTQISLFENGKENIYYLPSICYGISNDICYIYAVQNRGMFSNNPDFEKVIKRCLYKMNENVSSSESDDFKKYKELLKHNTNVEQEFYPENITDVSVSAILTLMVFMDSLNDMDIKKVKVVPFLPIRYKNKEDSYEKKYRLKLKQLGFDSDEKIKQTLENQRISIQKNLTEKLIRNFMRLKHHFNGINILSYPMELDEYLTLSIENMNCHNNKLINNILERKTDDEYTL